MAFDLAKVNWTDAELDAAEGLDKVYEGLADGVDMEDLLLLMEVKPLWDYLKSNTKAEYADKLAALVMILYRDNYPEPVVE